MNALNQMIAQGGRPIQIESPLNQMAQFEQIRGGQQANMLRQQQMADIQREREQLQTLNRLYGEAYDPATGRVDESRLYGRLAESGFGSQIPGLQEQSSKASKATAESKTAQLKFARDELGAILNAASSAVDQPSYDIARSNLQRLGIDVSRIPEVYDPKYVEQASREAMDAKQRVEAALSQTERQDKQLREKQKTDYSNYVRATVLKNPDAAILSKEEFLSQRAQPPATTPSTMGNRTITPFGGIEAAPSPVSARVSANAQMPTDRPTVSTDGTNVLPNVTIDDPNLIEPAVAALLATGDPHDKELAQMIEKRLVESRKRTELTGDFQNVMVAEQKIADLERKEQTPLVKRQIASLRKQINAANEGRAPKISNIVKMPEGVKAVDQKYAQDYLDWSQGGGADAAANMGQIKSVLDRLASGEALTGKAIGLAPDFFNALVNPAALGAKQQVEEVVQRNLRAVLGAQFTQVEGERLISRAFDARLSPQENVKRLRKLFMQMQTAAQQKQAMAEYFEANETLRKYKGKQPKMQDFYDALSTPDAPPKGSVDVKGPDGKTYRFPDKKSADEFRKSAGIKE